MPLTVKNSLKTRKSLIVEGEKYYYYSLEAAQKETGDISKLPCCLKILLENLLRHENGRTVRKEDIIELANRPKKTTTAPHEIAFKPARILMQDFTGVPALVDLAAMREAMAELGGNPKKINPLLPVDLVIDHSVMVDEFGSPRAFQTNVAREFERNGERYAFLKWGQQAFDNFRVVPPDTGICHQINLEHLAKVVWLDEKSDPKRRMIYPDTLLGTDSHTTMVNALGVLGWGVGGIEAQAAMLGQSVSMLVPDVIGLKISGRMKEGVTATDLVLHVTQMLRRSWVAGKFVEFCGAGLDALSLPDRATISNMAPEYGAICGFFPIDEETINYLKLTGRDDHHVKLVEEYAKAQGLWRDAQTPEPEFSQTMYLDLSSVEPSISGPHQPHKRMALKNAAQAFDKLEPQEKAVVPVAGADYKLGHGDIVIAAITGCLSTSNPSAMVAAGLLARKARAFGLSVKPWVKTSLAPGSRVVSEYLVEAGLQEDLDALGFNLVGYGCTTCFGNSGALPEPIAKAIEEGKLNVASVLSGNRNFEGWVSPQVKYSYLASPALVVAYALAGSMHVDITTEALGADEKGRDIYLEDIWPSAAEIAGTITASLNSEIFTQQYADLFKGPVAWRSTGADKGLLPDGEDNKEAEPAAGGNNIYRWQEGSTYVRKPPFFAGMGKEAGAMENINNAYALLVLGDNITTEQISPAGDILPSSPAGEYLRARQIEPAGFNSYGSRRGNDQVMTRGTFANSGLRNQILPETEGGFTKHIPSGEEMSIYDAAMRYQADEQPLIVIAGSGYGTGSPRDWAAKGTRLLGVKAVIAEGFDRIHRSNLIGMGVLPLQFKSDANRKTLDLCGDERYSITGIAKGLKPGGDVTLTVNYADGSERSADLTCRIDTNDELEYYRHGGILRYVLRYLVQG